MAIKFSNKGIRKINRGIHESILKYAANPPQTPPKTRSPGFL